MASAENLRPLHGAQAFRAELECLGQVWTLLGCACDIPAKDDWFRATLGGRSVFIQRFEDGLRGFENRCAHRSYPPRTEERGKGPMVCGFHQWRHDKEGVAAVIPICRDAYGVEPRALNQRLTRLDVEQCGALIFMRFAGGADTGLLAGFLGPAFPIIALLCADMRGAAKASLPTAANWRLSQQISLDDDHSPAVHPASFGRRGHPPREALDYHRFGPHSAYFLGATSGAMEAMAKALGERKLEAPTYRILHIFPNSLISLMTVTRPFGWPFRYVLIQCHIPLAFDRSETRFRISRHRADAVSPSLLHRLVALADPLLLVLVRLALVHFVKEDRAICGGLQRNARQIQPRPACAQHEMRVAWFDEAFAAAIRERGGE